MNLPVDRNAEVGIIGACLDGSVMGKVDTCIEAFDLVHDKCFFHDDTRIGFQCLKAIVSAGTAPDTISLYSKWKELANGLEFPVEFHGLQEQHTMYQLKNRAETLLDCYRRRTACLTADALRTAACDLAKPINESLAEFETGIAENSAKAPPIFEPRDAARALNDDLDRRCQLDGRLSGFSTGFPEWDRMTDGLQPVEFWIIGARPNVGKTALALNLTEQTAMIQKVPTLVVSLEMTAVAISRRMLSMNAGINGNSIRRGTFTPDEFKAVAGFYARYNASPIYTLDAPGGIGVSQLCNSIRAAVRRWGVKVVFIDYLQKIRPEKKGEKRTYDIGDISSRLIELTKRENIHMTALAQLNRDNEKDQRIPRLSDLADSKSIEADADFVGLLDRPVEGDMNRAQLIVAKQRDGERGIVPLEFRGWHCRFLPAQRTTA